MNTLRLLTVITVLTLLCMIPLNALAVSNGGFETGDFTGWSIEGEAFLVDNTFGTGPIEGTHQAVLTTLSETDETTDGFTISGIDAVNAEDLETFLGLSSGDLSNLGTVEGAAIQQEFKVKKGDILTFFLNFLTDETSSPSVISDRALVLIDGIIYDLASMSPAFVGTSETEFLDETGFFPFTHQFSKSGYHTLAIVVADHTDNIGASALVIDNIVLTTDVDDCEGLVGNAWGLCIAAYANNCDDPSNPSTECAQLAELYSDETGEEPPWIEPVNDPPVAIDDFYTIAQNTELHVPAPGVLENDTDPNGDSLTAVLVSTASNGHLELYAAGNFSYLPNAGFNGLDWFTYKANDGALKSEIAMVHITVTVPANIPPIASFTYSCTDLDCTFDGSASLDPDGTIVNYHWNFGDDLWDNKVITWHTYDTPGSYYVTLEVTDDEGATATDTVTIVVTAP